MAPDSFSNSRMRGIGRGRGRGRGTTSRSSSGLPMGRNNANVPNTHHRTSSAPSTYRHDLPSSLPSNHSNNHRQQDYPYQYPHQHESGGNDHGIGLGRGRGIGRGRGRGRGQNINLPAWMSSSEDAPQPQPPSRQFRQENKIYDDRKRPHHSMRNETQMNRGNIAGTGTRTDNGNAPKNKDDSKPSKSHQNQSLKLNNQGEKVIIQDKEEKEEHPQQQQQQQYEKMLEKQDEEQLQKLVQETAQSNNISSDIDASTDGDIFTSLFKTKEEQEEESAMQRRAKRKARLRQIASLDKEEEERGKEEKQNDLKQDETFSSMAETTNTHTATTYDSIKSTQIQQNDAEENENQPSKRQKLNESDDTNIEPVVTSTEEDGNDSFDMFASTSPLSISPHENRNSNNNNVQNLPTDIETTTQQNRGDDNDVQNYNDSEGYYKATIGEIISFSSQSQSESKQTKSIETRLKVMGIVGKGVFSTVLKCSLVSKQAKKEENNNNSNNDSEKGSGPVTVAVKMIRSNEVMTKAAEKEVRILRMLRGNGTNSKDSNNHYIVRMLELEDFEENEMNEDEKSGLKNKNNNNSGNVFFKQRPILEYRNHTVLLFDYMPNNLRQVLSKFGKNVGINLSSVKSYAKQLLLALKHLSSHGIIHADIKLDNILVTSNWTTIKLCDFGSAFLESDEEFINHIPTPYLVSRFYRAPEIILGLQYNQMIDLWSVAVSLAELFTGNVFFSGRTNNDMIKRFMEAIGPLSNKMIRRHISAFTKIGLKPHFEAHVGGGGNFDFRQQDFDKVTGKPIIRITSASQDHSVVVPSKQISQVILKSRSGSDNRTEVMKFADFLSRCLTLDPAKRISIDDSLSHDLFGS